MKRKLFSFKITSSVTYTLSSTIGWCRLHICDRTPAGGIRSAIYLLCTYVYLLLLLGSLQAHSCRDFRSHRPRERATTIGAASLSRYSRSIAIWKHTAHGNGPGLVRLLQPFSASAFLTGFRLLRATRGIRARLTIKAHAFQFLCFNFVNV